ncbi:IS3 family transposase [Actimicrobium sp. CCI2.3]|uniref:IS3 family transposase n=1 Tax=Actimicrobium sp. CCI2.3 TaxID=3048616 RepID=UPI002AB4A4AE|nr:IS3 family transposase [Actimicrobium sp. CCI2.3]MDY7573894.1 IS3 family transposase [Actimicrobium sp. CCI2.3]MDY7574477.1 IS3 family transposase [Actimicrobium sp. CCI2.3]MDY7574500.1 IS3 family transposase [Actimicrobium sp. CCI2.3]MDY7576108.1 IS3 family transposase [Actimicrobium sp. CCI2.3]
MTKKHFDIELKLEVVRMIKDQGLSISNVSKTMDVGPTAIRRWVTQHDAELRGEPGIGKPLTSDQQRIRSLERENRELRLDVSILKKHIGLLCPGTEMSYQLVTQLHKEAVSTARSCQLLAVSRSGYYNAQSRPAKPLFTKEAVHLKAAFAASRQSYGSRRLVSAVALQGIRIGRYKARSLMRQAGLKPVWKRKFIHTTDSKHDLAIAPNVLNRKFNPSGPNIAWVSDITYIRTDTGWLYLATVLDLFSRKLIGWATAPAMPAALVCEALRMAISSRNPPPGLIVHTDRGSQYASIEYQALLKRYGLVSSMSRKGNCWDNAVAERFFLNLKMECVWRTRYANQEEARKDVTSYIVDFYNCTRLHSVLGNLSPSVFERKMAEILPLGCPK